MLLLSGGRPPVPRRGLQWRLFHPRLLLLTGAVLLTAALPLAGAFAGTLGEGTRAVARPDTSARPDSAMEGAGPASAPDQDPKGSKSPEDLNDPSDPNDAKGSPLLSGLGLTAVARCGPELASPDGIEAQTCVLTEDGDTWARTYYRNATGQALSSVLTLMGPGDRTVQMRCEVGAADEPGACETPRERTRGEMATYTAVAEFAASGEAADRAETGPLLLRAGSDGGAGGADGGDNSSAEPAH